MNDHRLTRIALMMAVAVPFLYFGAQLLAIPFFPNYNMASQVASELGSPGSTQPWILNGGAILTGLALLAGAYGIARALFQLGAWPWITWIIGLILTMGGLGTLKAGIFPMPDPRHGSMGYLATALMVFSPLLLAALWPREDSLKMRIYLGASILVVMCLMPILSGAAGVDLAATKGLLQRIFALAVFPPIGVGAWFLLRRLNPASN